MASGVDLVGVADLDTLQELKTQPPDLLDPFNRALAIAIRLPKAIFDSINDRPTPIYASTYQTANRILDQIAFETALRLETDGFKALPIPASQVLDHKNWSAAISHKAVARMAGLGWQGKNLLLITSRFGSRVRLVTVLTDAPLTADQPLQNRCGNCTLCRDACPAGAIKGVNTVDHYQSRNEALYFSRCVKHLTQKFAQQPQIAAPICGICIKACPFGRRIKPNHCRKLTSKQK